jgi:hypothetical protein
MTETPKWKTGSTPDDWLVDVPGSVTWKGVFEGEELIAIFVGQDRDAYGDCRETLDRRAALGAAAPDLYEVARLFIRLDEATDQAVAQALHAKVSDAARSALSRADGGE